MNHKLKPCNKFMIDDDTCEFICHSPVAGGWYCGNCEAYQCNRCIYYAECLKGGNNMRDYKVLGEVKETHSIIVECDGHSYTLIFGKYEFGGFLCIPNWGIGCELASFNDKYWNTESLSKVLKRKRAVKAIVEAIANY